MRNELASCAAGVGEAQTIYDVVEAGLQQLEKRFTCYAALAQCAFENAPELFFEKPVLIPQLLFFTEGNCVIGLFAPRTSRAVHPRRIIFPLKCLGVTEERHTVTPAYFRFWSCVSGHFRKLMVES